jgi:hypothetical protein
VDNLMLPLAVHACSRRSGGIAKPQYVSTFFHWSSDGLNGASEVKPNGNVGFRGGIAISGKQ